MPSSQPKFLLEMIEKANENRGKMYRAKRGALDLTITEGGELKMNHFGTLILHAFLMDREVESVGGAYSQTDARYINATLSYFGLGHYTARIKQGDFEFFNEEEEVHA